MNWLFSCKIHICVSKGKRTKIIKIWEVHAKKDVQHNEKSKGYFPPVDFRKCKDSNINLHIMSSISKTCLRVILLRFRFLIYIFLLSGRWTPSITGCGHKVCISPQLKWDEIMRLLGIAFDNSKIFIISKNEFPPEFTRTWRLLPSVLLCFCAASSRVAIIPTEREGSTFPHCTTQTGGGVRNRNRTAGTTETYNTPPRHVVYSRQLG